MNCTAEHRPGFKNITEWVNKEKHNFRLHNHIFQAVEWTLRLPLGRHLVVFCFVMFFFQLHTGRQSSGSKLTTPVCSFQPLARWTSWAGSSVDSSSLASATTSQPWPTTQLWTSCSSYPLLPFRSSTITLVSWSTNETLGLPVAWSVDHQVDFMQVCWRWVDFSALGCLATVQCWLTWLLICLGKKPLPSLLVTLSSSKALERWLVLLYQVRVRFISVKQSTQDKLNTSKKTAIITSYVLYDELLRGYLVQCLFNGTVDAPDNHCLLHSGSIWEQGSSTMPPTPTNTHSAWPESSTSSAWSSSLQFASRTTSYNARTGSELLCSSRTRPRP